MSLGRPRIARHRPRAPALVARARRLAVAWLALALLVAARAGLAQSDPPPFWLPEPPSKDEVETKPKKKQPPKAEKPKAEKKKRAPARERVEPGEDAPPPKKPARKPSAPKPAATKPQAPARAQPVERAPEQPAPPQKKRYEPLPPLPHVEPEALPPRAPPVAAPRTTQPVPAPTYTPPSTSRPSQPPAAAQPARPTIAPQPAPPAFAPAPPRAQPSFAPPPQTQTPPPQTYAPPPQTFAPQQQPAFQPRPLPIEEQPEEEEAPPPKLRRFSAELVAGFWAKALSDGASRKWQLSYGADLGLAIFRFLQVDARVLRSGGTEGNAYVNAATSHILVDARALGVFNASIVGIYGGVGAGVVFEHTQLAVQDVNTDPITLSSNGIEAIGELTAGVRVRPWRGLTVHIEADGFLRQGNTELAFVLGAGWAF